MTQRVVAEILVIGGVGVGDGKIGRRARSVFTQILQNGQFFHNARNGRKTFTNHSHRSALFTVSTVHTSYRPPRS